MRKRDNPHHRACAHNLTYKRGRLSNPLVEWEPENMLRLIMF